MTAAWVAGVAGFGLLQQYRTPALDMSTEKPKLLVQMKGRTRARHLSPRTEQAYVGLIRRYIRYHGTRHPGELGEAEVVAYLTHLAAERRVSRSTQMQALSALRGKLHGTVRLIGLLLYGAGLLLDRGPARRAECLTMSCLTGRLKLAPRSAAS